MADKMVRAMAYLNRLPVAVSGAGGHNQTLRAACECYRFGLSKSEAAEALAWYNEYRCQPKWSAHELAHKLADAERIVSGAGQGGKHLGPAPARNYQRGAHKPFVAPPPPARKVKIVTPFRPVWEVSEAEEEARWASVAATLGITLVEFDERCGVEVERVA